jgi:hypothetical protein
MASFGPAWRSRYLAILDVALLRLRLQNSCGLGLKPKSTISGWTLILIMRPLENVQFCSRPRQAKILTTDMLQYFED